MSRSIRDAVKGRDKLVLYCTNIIDSYMRSCLASGDFSDFVITCGDDRYDVHKMIVCTRSEFFARAVKFGGKVCFLCVGDVYALSERTSNATQETNEGKVDLPEDEPAIVKLLVQYLYEGEYRLESPDGPGFRVVNAAGSGTTPDEQIEYTCDFPHTCDGANEGCMEPVICPHHTCGLHCESACIKFLCSECTETIEPPEQLLTHAKMYEIGDQYGVQGLKELSRKKSSKGCPLLWKADDFAMAANHAFSTTAENDEGLRAIVIGTILEHMELIRKPEIQALMVEFSSLALGVLLKKADEHGWGVR